MLKMYKLQLCAPACTTGSYFCPSITPVLVGFAFRPQQSSSQINKAPPMHLSHLEADEEEQDQTRFFDFGSTLPSLSADQKLRFRRFVLDLNLGKHLREKGLMPCGLGEGKGVIALQDTAEAGEPKLIMVHSAESQVLLAPEVVETIN